MSIVYCLDCHCEIRHQPLTRLGSVRCADCRDGITVWPDVVAGVQTSVAGYPAPAPLTVEPTPTDAHENALAWIDGLRAA